DHIVLAKGPGAVKAQFCRITINLHFDIGEGELAVRRRLAMHQDAASGFDLFAVESDVALSGLFLSADYDFGVIAALTQGSLKVVTVPASLLGFKNGLLDCLGLICSVYTRCPCEECDDYNDKNPVHVVSFQEWEDGQGDGLASCGSGSQDGGANLRNHQG